MGGKINVIHKGMFGGGWAPCIVVELHELEKQRVIVQVKLKDLDQVNFVRERQP